MESDKKVKEGGREREELMMGEMLRRGILVGKREGNSTPSPTWNFGLIQADGTLVQDFNFSAISRTLSARKLCANLWEMQPQVNLGVVKMSKNVPNLRHHEGEDHKVNGGQQELDEAPAPSPSKQSVRDINLRNQLDVSVMRHNLRVKTGGHAQQPLSPASCSSSSEIAAHSPAITPNSALVSNGESSHRLKTSTELLKVLNIIWSLEEKHALDMSLVKALRSELNQSQARVQELLLEKKRDKNEIDNLLKQITEYKVTRKKEQDRIRDAVKSVETKLEEEVKLRRNSEKLNHKELSEMKSSLSNASRELEREKKARMLLEDLCDEFAKGIRAYEQEIRLMKKEKSRKERIGKGEGNDRFILHISEAWLDERTQMKLADHDLNISEKLFPEIEAFLRARQLSKGPCESSVPAHSLESLHINEPQSAPWNGNDEDDSVLEQGKGRKWKFTPKPVKLVIEEPTRSRMEGSFDPFMFVGPLSPVKKWTSDVSGVEPDILESSSRWPNAKPNTLKAKLMEARLEGQLSRSRSKVVI